MVTRDRLHLALGDIVGGVVCEMTGERPSVLRDPLTIGPCAIDPTTHARLRREFLESLIPQRPRNPKLRVDDWDEATGQLTNGGTLSIWTISEPNHVLFLAWCAFHALRAGHRFQIVHRPMVRYPYAPVHNSEPSPLPRETLVLWSDLWTAYCEGRVDDVLAANIAPNERRTLRRAFQDLLPRRRDGKWRLSRFDEMLMHPLATGEILPFARLGCSPVETDENAPMFIRSDWCFRRISSFAICESPWVRVVERHVLNGRWKLQATPLGLDRLQSGFDDWSVVPTLSACGVTLGGQRPAWYVNEAGEILKG